MLFVLNSKTFIGINFKLILRKLVAYNARIYNIAISINALPQLVRRVVKSFFLELFLITSNTVKSGGDVKQTLVPRSLLPKGLRPYPLPRTPTLSKLFIHTRRN